MMRAQAMDLAARFAADNPGQVIWVYLTTTITDQDAPQWETTDNFNRVIKRVPNSVYIEVTARLQ